VLRRYKPICRLFLQILVGHLPEPAEHMLVNRFIPVEKAGAAECHRAGVTENLPLPLRCLYRERRTSAIYQLAFDEAAIDKIKGQCLKADDSGHLFPPESAGQRALLPVQRCRARASSFQYAPLGEGLVSRNGTIRMT